MNKIHRIIWSHARRAFVVASELATTAGGSSTASGKAAAAVFYAILLAGAFGATPVWALTQASGATVVGDIVTDPSTGIDSKVIAIATDAQGATIAAFTESNILLYTTVDVNDTLPLDNNIWTVTSVQVNPTTKLVDQITITRNTGSSSSETMILAVASDQSALVNAESVNSLGGPPNPGGALPTPTIPSGNFGLIYDVRQGRGGSNGDNGYGVRIPFVGTIGYPGSAGGDGTNGPDIETNGPRIVTSTNGDITTVTDNLSGIQVGSVGGNGGNGGSFFGAAGNGYDGGNGGSGGDVSVRVNPGLTITTSGSVSFPVKLTVKNRVSC